MIFPLKVMLKLGISHCKMLILNVFSNVFELCILCCANAHIVHHIFHCQHRFRVEINFPISIACLKCVVVRASGGLKTRINVAAMHGYSAQKWTKI